MFYTAVSRAEGGINQRISSVVSDDLFTWRREPDRQVLEPDARWYETAETRQWPDQAWRDPWVFRDRRRLAHADHRAREPRRTR